MSRVAISDEQRAALRRWYRMQRPRPRQTDAAAWFEREFTHRISQSTVSESLSNRYAHLDNMPQGLYGNIGSSFRQRLAQWPILESILSDWQTIIERRGSVVTGDMILEKAQQVWPLVPQYQDQNQPRFSSGWLENFRKRHNIRKSLHTSRLGSAAIGIHQAHNLNAVQGVCNGYAEEDIFNMSETGLFWRLGPSPINDNKSRIALICCTNYKGTERFPLWIVGDTSMPHTLDEENFQALGCVWRDNHTASMNNFIMAEWLRAFYASISPDRAVLLILNHSEPHVSGLELAAPPPNIRLQWMPSSDTASWAQPFDQGLFRRLKQYYRKHWLGFMIEQFERKRNPMETINVYQAVSWLSRVWFYDILNAEIFHAFQEAKIRHQQQIIAPPQDLTPSLSYLYGAVQRVGSVQPVRSVGEFLNPLGENIWAEVSGAEDISDMDLFNLVQWHISHVEESAALVVESESEG